MKTTIQTSILINANVEQVWEIFSDFDKYGQWNPFIKSLKGEVRKGNTIRVILDDMKFKPTILSYTPNKEFIWLGHLLFKGIFDGRHEFKFQDNGDGTTTFIHQEYFNGILVRLFKKKLHTETKNGFEQMNKALKERVERSINL